MAIERTLGRTGVHWMHLPNRFERNGQDPDEPAKTRADCTNRAMSGRSGAINQSCILGQDRPTIR
jgi:hypothetical protein